MTRPTKQPGRISTEILGFVSNWITHHIRESDMQYATVIQEQTVPASEDHLART